MSRIIPNWFMSMPSATPLPSPIDLANSGLLIEIRMLRSLNKVLVECNQRLKDDVKDRDSTIRIQAEQIAALQKLLKEDQSE